MEGRWRGDTGKGGDRRRVGKGTVGALFATPRRHRGRDGVKGGRNEDRKGCRRTWVRIRTEPPAAPPRRTLMEERRLGGCCSGAGAAGSTSRADERSVAYVGRRGMVRGEEGEIGRAHV